MKHKYLIVLLILASLVLTIPAHSMSVLPPSYSNWADHVKIWYEDKTFDIYTNYSMVYTSVKILDTISYNSDTILVVKYDTSIIYLPLRNVLRLLEIK